MNHKGTNTDKFSSIKINNTSYNNLKDIQDTKEYTDDKKQMKDWL